MATPVLIIGKSGSGKSTSLRNCQNERWNLIRVLNKPLPFKGKIDGWFTDDYQQVMKCLIASKAESIVIDDAGYLITNHFMKGHASAGKGNAVFALYNDIGDYFWNLIQFIVTKVPQNKIVYLMMHEEKDDSGEVKPKEWSAVYAAAGDVQKTNDLLLKTALPLLMGVRTDDGIPVLYAGV